MCGRYRRTTQEEELAQALSHPDPKADRFTDQLQYRPESKGSDHPIQSRNSAALARCIAMAIDSILGEESKDRLRAINARAETVDEAPSFRQAFTKTALLDSCGRILRIA